MSKESGEIFVGILTVAVLAAIFGLVSMRGDEPGTAPADGHYRISAVFDQVDGLYPGDGIRLGGIRIGTVESQRLDDRHRAVLTFAIDRDVALPLDTSAAVHTSGLFGSKFVELEPGGDYDYLGNGDEIVFTQGSLVISDLLDMIIARGKSRRGESR